MSIYRTLFCFAAVFAAASVPTLAAVKTITPEPKLGVLMALGVGAIVLIARKVKRR